MIIVSVNNAVGLFRAGLVLGFARTVDTREIKKKSNTSPKRSYAQNR